MGNFTVSTKINSVDIVDIKIKNVRVEVVTKIRVFIQKILKGVNVHLFYQENLYKIFKKRVIMKIDNLKNFVTTNITLNLFFIFVQENIKPFLKILLGPVIRVLILIVENLSNKQDKINFVVNLEIKKVVFRNSFL